MQAAPAGAKTHGAETKISPALLALSRAHPKDDFAVIVQAGARPGNGHRAERAAAAVGRANGKTGRALSIIGGTSARLAGHEILDLAEDSDVAYIASDDLVVASFDPTAGAAAPATPGSLQVGASHAWPPRGVTGRRARV